ncbi:MAG: WYL domain-containing protein [Betaproteobacteria bacterium]|nr:WYL domain-containing protein [Betaproteobacteria bacterium]
MAGDRKDSLDTAFLLLEILKRIPKGRKITAAELQEQLAAKGLARDIRSIQRHLDTLSERFDIERDDRSKPYGYRWKEGAEGIALPSLSPQESLLLKMAHEHLRALLPPKLSKTLAGFFDQAESNLGPGTSAKQERAWLKKVRVVPTSQPLLPPEVKAAVFEAVTEALFENRYLEVVYKNASGQTVEAKVMPLGLAQQGPRLYLVCRFDGYDNERNLALHRFVRVVASTLTFEYPKDFDLAKFDADGHFGYGNGEKVRLSFRIDKEAGLHITESPLSKDQVVVEHEDCYEISATVVDSAMLEWWLRGFGDAVWDIARTEMEKQ